MSDKKLIVFLKYPEKGKVKTRIAAALGNDFALELHRCLIYDISAITRKVDADTVIAYSGPEGASFPDFPENRFFHQRGKDLGSRMYNAFVDVFSGGAENCVLIGSDIPGITAILLDDAFKKLEHSDMVIGPASDGGYYCIGFKRNGLNRIIFKDIPWSTDNVFSETVKRVQETDLTVKYLLQLSDIDDIKDLRKYYNNNISNTGASQLMKFLNTHKGVINEFRL
jgi:uncharacterized protein